MNKLYPLIITFTTILIFNACYNDNSYYQCISDKTITDAIKAYTVQIPDADAVRNPVLIILAKGVAAGEGLVTVNGMNYDIPAIPGATAAREGEAPEESGKAGWYHSVTEDDLMAKIMIPLPGVGLKNGKNHIVFTQAPQTDGYLVYDARLASGREKEARVLQLTYRIVSRGEDPRIDDFDFVVNYNDEGKRRKTDLPPWAARGKVRYYRAGIDFDHLDRLFEMFKEGHFNLVMLQVSTPHDTSGEEYRRYKAFIDRCHLNGIRVTFDGGASGQPIRLNAISADSVLAHPEMETWLSRDEYGEPRWRRKDVSYWPDLNNKDYRNRVMQTAALAIDTGVDELYYDWAIGGTQGIVSFFQDVQALIRSKGKNLTVFGNCKGNIIADGICDIGKSEGTEEAGIWDGRWVHNVAQAKFYYAAGDGWKPYRSKYEGADPGVPNPGAHSVVDDMKTGWKRPMAEARAFQSDFVIAEAGGKLLNGWLEQNNSVAMTAWKDICDYNSFFAEREEYYTDVTTSSRIGVLAPPVIPSFESSVKRIQLYSALIEMNIMYDIILLAKLVPAMMARYDMIIIPDIPWLDEEQLAAVRTYKERGGKVCVMGSCPELQELATVNVPAYYCHETQKREVRQELNDILEKWLPRRIIRLDEQTYVLANMVQKTNSSQVIIHLVNYSDSVKNLRVRLNLEGIADSIRKEKIKCYSPDAVPGQLHEIVVHDKDVSFIVPELNIYALIVIN